MMNKRDLLKQGAGVACLLMSAGYLPSVAAAEGAAYISAAFDAKTVADVMKALGSSAPVASTDVTVQCPDIAENGAVVPLGATVNLPGVKRVLLMVEKNPNALSAMFEPGEFVDPVIATRVKVGQSSNVLAIAMMTDGRVLYAQKEVKVTLGGCGG